MKITMKIFDRYKQLKNSILRCIYPKNIHKNENLNEELTGSLPRLPKGIAQTGPDWRAAMKMARSFQTTRRQP